MRIRVEDLGDEVRERLARGEPVEIERNGEVVARMEPCAPPANRRVDWRERFEARKGEPPLDDAFEEDLAEVLRFTNRPAEAGPWE